MDIIELDIDIDSLANALSEEIASETLGDPSKSLISPKAQKERLKLKVVEQLNKEFLALAKGFNSLVTHTQELINSKELTVNQSIFDGILTKMSEKRIDELTSEELNALYHAAVDLYNHQQYEEAADAFYVLTELDPGQALFWKGLGHARFHHRKFADAIDAYTQALTLNSNDIESLIHKARSLQNDHQTQIAKDVLSEAKKLITNNLQLNEWQDTVNALIQECENK